MIHEREDFESFPKWLLVELFRAYRQAKKGKLKSQDAHIFELNEMENLVNLRDEILAREYEPGRGVAFVQKSPVIREIFAANFRDRVVHQFVFNVVEGYWERHFIFDSYAGREMKGTWFGIKRAEKNMRRASLNYSVPTYVVKLDLLSFFTSLDREKVLERVIFGLDRQFPRGGELYRTVKYLCRKIYLDDPCEGVKRLGNREDWELVPKSKSLFYQREGKGLVVGNLSSQMAANIYLDQLDRYVKFKLQRKYYGRYVDDFYFFSNDEEGARTDVRKIERYLKEELELTLHPKKRYIEKIERGLPYLGVMIYPGRVVPGKKVVGNFRRAVREVTSGEREVEDVMAYLGYMANLNGYNVTKKIFLENGWGWEE